MNDGSKQPDPRIETQSEGDKPTVARKPWEEPEIVTEQSLVVRADGELPGDDLFIGPLGTSP